MIHELREYSLRRGAMTGYLDLVHGRMLALRGAVAGRLVGFFRGAAAGSNRVVHLWEYDSLDARQAARSVLAADLEWRSKFAFPALAYIQAQQVSFLEVVEQRPCISSSEPAMYLLHRCQTEAGQAAEVCRRLMGQRARGGTERLASYLSISPDANGVLQLLRVRNLGLNGRRHAADLRVANVPNVRAVRTEALLPTAVSPLQ